MQLHYKKVGEGTPFIILHGLFGSGDNWMSFARTLSEKRFAVYLVDLRNHGHSPHDISHNYQLMSDDLHELMLSENLQNVIVLGHSMGGKAAMQLTIDHADDLSALIVVDIATHYYPVHHRSILDALLSVDFTKVSSREEVDQQLGLTIKENSTRQFLMKNLYRKEDKNFGWRFNLTVLNEQIDFVGQEITSAAPIHLPVLFVKGANSNYINEEQFEACKKIFPDAKLAIIEKAGHWVHADQPLALLESVLGFVQGIK